MYFFGECGTHMLASLINCCLKSVVVFMIYDWVITETKGSKISQLLLNFGPQYKSPTTIN